MSKFFWRTVFLIEAVLDLAIIFSSLGALFILLYILRSGI